MLLEAFVYADQQPPPGNDIILWGGDVLRMRRKLRSRCRFPLIDWRCHALLNVKRRGKQALS
jgi:hypothetical protein